MSPLLEEMPDRAEEYSVPLEKGDARKGRGIYYPRYHTKNPSGGIRSYLAVRLGLANALVCLFLYLRCCFSD